MPWNPKYGFLRTWKRASPEVFVFKGKIFSPCWVLTKSHQSCRFSGIPILSPFTVQCFSWYVSLLREMHAGLGPHSGAGNITYLSFSTFFLLFHHTVCTHRTRGWVFPVEKELGYRRHSFSPPVFIKRQPRLFSIGWHSYVFKPIADLFKGEPGFLKK